MSAISSCPLCAKQVSLPAAPPDAQVRCPLCHGEFQLQAALNLAPPMLELISVPVDSELSYHTETSNGLAMTAPVMASAAIAEHESLPTFAETSPAPDLSDDLSFDAPPADDLDVVGLDVESLDEPDTELEGKTPTIDDLMADTTGTDDLDLVETPAEDSPFSLDAAMAKESGEAGAEADETEADSGVPTFSASSAARRRKREPSFIGNLIGVVGGGVVGCGLAYFIVLWIGGPDKDFLELGPKLPKWMLPSAFSKPQTAAVTPMSPNPTPTDLAEVKQAGQGEDEPEMKLNVPKLPDGPQGEDLSNNGKLPFDDSTEPADQDGGDSLDAPEDLANDLSIDSPTIDAPVPTKPAKPEDGEEEMPADEETPAEVEGESETSDNGAIGLKEPVSYTADKVDAALADVNKAQEEAVAAGGKDSKLNVAHFKKLCQLGEVATFVSDGDASLAAISEMLSQLATDEAKIALFGKAGANWLKYDLTKRGNTNGAFLAGKVEDVSETGKLFRVELMPTGGKSPVSIYASAKPEVAVGDTVLVLGSIVTDPQQKLHNFSGDEEIIVWHGLSVKAGQ